MSQTLDWFYLPIEAYNNVQFGLLFGVAGFLLIWHFVAWYFTTGARDEPWWKRPFSRILKFWTLYGYGFTYYFIIWGYALAQLLFVMLLTFLEISKSINLVHNNQAELRFWMISILFSCIETIELFALIIMTEPPAKGMRKMNLGMWTAFIRAVFYNIGILLTRLITFYWFHESMVVHNYKDPSNALVHWLLNFYLLMFYIPRYAGLLKLLDKKEIYMSRFHSKGYQDVQNTISLFPILYDNIDKSIEQATDHQQLEDELASQIDNFYKEYLGMRLDNLWTQAKFDLEYLTVLYLERQNRKKIIFVISVLFIWRLSFFFAYGILLFTASWNALKVGTFLETVRILVPLLFFFSFTRLNFHMRDYVSF